MVIFIESFCIIINTILYICSTEKWSGCIRLKGGCIYRVSCLSSFTQSYTLSYKDIKRQCKYVLIASLGSQWISQESNPEQYLIVLQNAISLFMISPPFIAFVGSNSFFHQNQNIENTWRNTIRYKTTWSKEKVLINICQNWKNRRMLSLEKACT